MNHSGLEESLDAEFAGEEVEFTWEDDETGEKGNCEPLSLVKQKAIDID